MKRQISCVEIDINGTCDFRCSFCYFTKKQVSDEICCGNTANSCPLASDEIKAFIDQAGQFGVEKIVLYDRDFSDTYDLINFIRVRDMDVEIRSDGACMGEAASEAAHNLCLKHKFSCFVSYNGIVYPCAGLLLPIGNLRENPFEKIISDSEVLENLFNHNIMIKGPCRDCSEFSNCYGCRGRAFAMTGDYLASDPLCRKNEGKSGRINCLPMSVENLIPHKNGMRLVSGLLNVGERCAEVESVFSRKSPFIKQNGMLEDVAYMEIMAQSAAAMNGFSRLDTGLPKSKGFLIGGRNINIYGRAYAGDRLITRIYKTAKFGNFGILTAQIMRDGELISEGEIKIYQYDDE